MCIVCIVYTSRTDRHYKESRANVFPKTTRARIDLRAVVRARSCVRRVCVRSTRICITLALKYMCVNGILTGSFSMYVYNAHIRACVYTARRYTNERTFFRQSKYTMHTRRRLTELHKETTFQPMSILLATSWNSTAVYLYNVTHLVHVSLSRSFCFAFSGNWKSDYKIRITCARWFNTRILCSIHWPPNDNCTKYIIHGDKNGCLRSSMFYPLMLFERFVWR